MSVDRATVFRIARLARIAITDEEAGRLVPKEAQELLGQPIFIKGYIRPDSVQARSGIDQFLLFILL